MKWYMGVEDTGIELIWLITEVSIYDCQSEFPQPHQNLVYGPIQRLIDVGCFASSKSDITRHSTIYSYNQW